MRPTEPGPLAAYRHLWLPELAVLIGIAVATIALFNGTDLDLVAARAYYRPESDEPWPLARGTFWALLYHSAPWVTGSLALAGAALLVAGVRHPSRQRWRVHGGFILLAVILGPGLVINGVLKDHWGRPRPRQLAEFGGLFEYQPPLIKADTPGRSFPCGHCSVGYLYGLGWWLWRRSHPRRARFSLAAGITIGTLLGLGRMAAGGHFLSDAIWSALIGFGIAHLLYYHVLRIPAREDRQPSLYPLIDRSPRLRRAVIVATITLAAGIVVGGIVASPHDRDLSARVALDAYVPRPQAFEVIAETLDVELRLVDSRSGEIGVVGYLHGFGLPGNELLVAWEFEPAPVPTLRFRITQKGWFPDIDGLARLEIPAGQLDSIRVAVDRGDISITDAEESNAPGRPQPEFDLTTRDGRVRRF